MTDKTSRHIHLLAVAGYDTAGEVQGDSGSDHLHHDYPRSLPTVKKLAEEELQKHVANSGIDYVSKAHTVLALEAEVAKMQRHTQDRSAGLQQET